MNEERVHELAVRVIDDMGGAFIMANQTTHLGAERALWT